MKRIIIFLSTLTFLGQTLHAQEINVKTRKMSFKTKLYLMNGSVNKGYLQYLTDSSLTLSKIPVRLQSTEFTGSKLRTFDYSSLKEVRLTRSKSVGRGILYGVLIGTVTGFIAGVAQGDNPDITYHNTFFGTYTWPGTTAIEKGAEFAFVGAVSGVVVGGIIGALVHKTFIIQGRKNKFTEMKMTTLERIYYTDKSK